VRNCNRFPAPDQACSSLSEAFPATLSQLTWISICRAIPTLHRLNGNAISQLQGTANQGLQQWGCITTDEFVIARDLYAE
jgi:hypothetical protein